MMAKKNETLIKEFKEIEDELVKVLQIEPAEILEDTPSGMVKKDLRVFIKKVNKAKEVFQKYEAKAIEIQKIAEAETEPRPMTDAVVDLRETMIDEDKIIEATQAEYVDEKVIEDGKVKAVIKKQQSQVTQRGQ
ncbi:MAG: hypothetical protein IJ538_04885 [Clostridia bacterium]|nr:hypothetical protein [Clostridia bacterium]